MPTPTTFSDVYAGQEMGDWTRLWILKPDRTLGTILDRFVEADIEILAFGQGQATVKIPRTSRACDLTYEGNTALEDDFVNYGLNFYYRDPGDGTQKRFMGVVGPREKQWMGHEDTAFYTITFVSLLQEILSRRQVMTATSIPYTYTGGPDNCMRDVISKQLESGSVVTPSGYPSTRTRFGPSTDPWTVSVENVKGTPDHPDSMTYTVAHGTQLNQVVLELCLGLVPSTGNPCDLWPVLTETSPTNFNITVLYGRSGVGRAVGATLDDKVFAPERNTLTGFTKRIDTATQANVIGIRGKSQNQPNYEEFVYDSSSVNKYGVIEDSWQAPEATSQAELQWEAYLHLNQIKNGIASYEARVREGPGMRYGHDVEEGDTVTLYSGKDSFDEAAVKDILGVRINIPAPGWPKVDFLMGQFQRSLFANMIRHGGGGGRSGGGGRPNQKTGDECPSYEIIYDDDAKTAQANRCGNEFQHYGLKNANPNSVIYNQTDVTDVDGSAGGTLGAGSCDRMLHKVIGIYFEGTVDHDGYVYLELSGGSIGKIPIELVT